MTALDITNLTFTYSPAKTPSLQNISFEVDTGEMVAVVGASNSGKSTLCYAITGIVPHFYHGEFSGSVRVNDICTRDLTISELSRQVGLVMQIPGNQLSGIRYTVFEEIAFGMENLGMSRGEMMDRTTAVLALTGLSDYSHRSPYQLSGGQQQKLALAIVLAVSPPVLVLDEPTTFLDPQSARQVYAILFQLKKRGTTIIFVEQRLEQVAEHADRVILLKEGELLLTGSPSEVLTSEEIRNAGLEWTRYTKVAELAERQGIWAKTRRLPATFRDTVACFTKISHR